MLLLKVLALAASASTSLVIPDVSQEEEDNISHKFPIDNCKLLAMANASVCLPCAECTGRDTKIWIDFAIKNNKTLAVNDHVIYPQEPLAQGKNGTIPLTAVLTSDGAQPIKPRVEELAYDLTVTADEEVAGVSSLIVKITKVGKYDTRKIPKMKLKVIEISSEGDIHILAEAGGTKKEESNKLKKPSAKSCKSLQCELATIVDAFWIHTALLITDSPLLKSGHGITYTRRHYDDDSVFAVLWAVILFIEFCVLMATFFMSSMMILMSPIILLVVVASSIEKLLGRIRRRDSGRNAAEAVEGEKSGLLND